MVLHVTRLLSGGVVSKVKHVLSLFAACDAPSPDAADLFWYCASGITFHIHAARSCQSGVKADDGRCIIAWAYLSPKTEQLEQTHVSIPLSIYNQTHQSKTNIRNRNSLQDAFNHRNRKASYHPWDDDLWPRRVNWSTHYILG